VSPVWAASAIALIGFGRALNSIPMRVTGQVTLALMLGRLFLIVLAFVDPIWRVVLFIAVGSALVASAYFLPHWAEALRTRLGR